MHKSSIEIYFKGLIKRLIWNVTKVEKNGRSKKDIFFFTLGRSGSTWLTELIAKEKGVRPVTQPLTHSELGEDELKQIPLYYCDRFISMEESEKDQLKRYLQRILNGEFHVSEPWNFWSPSFDYKADRHIINITNANAMIDWFAEEFDAYILYSIRHPIPRWLSANKLGWGQSSKAYLKDEQFVKNYLNDELYDYSMRILAEGHDIEKHTLGWALENLVPLKYSTKLQDYVFINYEEAVLYPEKTIRYLSEKLELSDVDKMIENANKPSRSFNYKNKDAANKLNDKYFDHKKYMISRWKKEVDRDLEVKALDVLSTFSIDVYIPDRLIPKEKYLNFAEK